MARIWIVIYTTLSFAAWTSTEQVYILQAPHCPSCTWTWNTGAYAGIPDVIGWSHPDGQNTRNRYTVCNRDKSHQPNNWLRSGIIPVGDIYRLNVTIRYFVPNCVRSDGYCKEPFFAYVWESNTSVTDQQIPHPINNYSSYRRFATIRPLSGAIHTLTVPLQVKSKFVVLGFRDQGGCRTLYSVKVSYEVCPGKTLKDSLVSLPRTLSDFESIRVEGSCMKDSVQDGQGSLIVFCESNGEWNTSGLEGRCVCKEGTENDGGVCKACSRGTYNEGKGLNCTVIPSEPRNASVSFVNQSSAVITWFPPAITGTETDLMYDVNCQRSCTYFAKDCDDERCDGGFSDLVKNEGLKENNLTIWNLATFVNYTCKISAKNRVSEVAERSPSRGTVNFALVNLRSKGSVPSKPDVTVYLAEDGSIELSWELICKNGIIQGYRVVYFKEGEPSDAETVATKEKVLRIKSLAPGETFEFQVFVVNNFGEGPPGVRTFKMPSVAVAYLLTGPLSKIIIAATAGGGGLLLVIVIVILSLFIFRFRRRTQNRIVQRLEHSQNVQVSSPHETEILMDHILPETNIDGTRNNGALYMDIGDIPSFELEREDISFERLLGSGNFGEVFKAVIGNNSVAVKSLKENATPKDKADMITELTVMKSLNPHPHVVRLIGCCSLSDPLLIVLEYLPYGDLLGYLRKSRGHSDIFNSGEKKPTSMLSAKDLLSFAWMIADGMKYLAEMKIVHRDLAARNILVGENKVCKISDFGLARDVNADIYVRTSQARLPVKWMPPESIFRGECSTMSDVWSYGIVLWEIFTIGDSPYPGVKGMKVTALLERGYRMPRPIHISEELYAIMSECWSEKPEERPTFQWICAAMKRLINDQKSYINLDVYNDKDYVNFDMVEEL